MMGKSPLMKKLVGKQGNLPENLKSKIEAAPESPAKIVDIKEGSLGAKARDIFNQSVKDFKEYREKNLAKTDAYLKKEGINRGGETQKKKTEGGTKPFYPTPDGKLPKVKKEPFYPTPDGKLPKKVTKPKPVKGKSFLSTGSVSAGKGSIKMPSTSGSPAMPSFASKASQSGKKVINRDSSFTDEYGNTFERSVKGRKKADGSSYKTISNKTNNNTTSEKDVAKGPKVKGKRRSKTVIKSKFDSKGDVRKVVEKTRGQKRKVLSDSEIIKRRENLKADRKKRDESPTKMKTKTPSKMMKKAPSKMMKKAAAPKMMKKAPAKMMKKKKK